MPFHQLQRHCCTDCRDSSSTGSECGTSGEGTAAEETRAGAAAGALEGLPGVQAVLAEAIQTVMRRHGIDEPYEKLKALTRGQEINAKTLAAFVATLDMPEDAKQSLAELTPGRYVGIAAELADRFAKG